MCSPFSFCSRVYFKMSNVRENMCVLVCANESICSCTNLSVMVYDNVCNSLDVWIYDCIRYIIHYPLYLIGLTNLNTQYIQQIGFYFNLVAAPF